MDSGIVKMHLGEKRGQQDQQGQVLSSHLKMSELPRTFNDFEPIRIQNERIAKDIRRF